MFITLIEAFTFFGNWLVSMANRHRLRASVSALLAYASGANTPFSLSFMGECLVVAWERDGEVEFAERFQISN
jgi:hypothetical protein